MTVNTLPEKQQVPKTCLIPNIGSGSKKVETRNVILTGDSSSDGLFTVKHGMNYVA